MKSKYLSQGISTFAVGFVFSVGLALSGMTQPQKVINLFDLSNWDPSLLFVMLGATGVHMITYPLVRKRASPLLDTKWHVPTRKDVTARLVIGSAIFGIGWGLGGFCPGPALTSLASADSRPLIFVVAMIIGMLLFKKTERFLRLKE